MFQNAGVNQIKGCKRCVADAVTPSFPRLTNCAKRVLARSNQADVCINQKELISRHRQLNGNPLPLSTTNHPPPSTPAVPIFHFVVKTKAPLIVFPVFTILTVWSGSYGGSRKTFLDITNSWLYLRIIYKTNIIKSVRGGGLTDGIGIIIAGKKRREDCQ